MRALIWISMLALAGCDGSAVTPGNDAGSPADTGAAACGEPGGGYGTSVGSNLAPLTLDNCAGQPFEVYGQQEGYCEARFTVLGIAAGWCNPCRMEASQMQANLVQRYAGQGVRVVVALVQNNDYGPPDGAFCQSWVDQYGLTNNVLIDPHQDTQIYFPGNALPANVIFDNHGVIRHREYGATLMLESLTSKLDQLLAENP